MADYRIVTETGVEDRIADATSGLLSKTAADGIYVPLSGPRRRPHRRHRRGCADPRQLPVTPPIPEHHSDPLGDVVGFVPLPVHHLVAFHREV